MGTVLVTTCIHAILSSYLASVSITETQKQQQQKRNGCPEIHFFFPGRAEAYDWKTSLVNDAGVHSGLSLYTGHQGATVC